MVRTSCFNKRFATDNRLGPSKETGAKGVVAFVDDAEDYDPTKDYKKFSLNDFYASLADFKLTDKVALEYMTFGAKMSCVKFKTEAEMLAFKGDFVAALAFVSKLDEVDVRGVEPLGNVFEYYEGNELKMRGSNEFENTEHLHFT